MGDGTRSKIIDESLKSLHESQQQMQANQASLRSDLDSISTSLEEQKKMLNMMLANMGPRAPSFNAESSSGGSRHKPAPIYLARFAGEHPERWVAQANRYFDFYSIPEPDRLTIASFYFDGGACDWYDWMQRNYKLAGWENFTESLIQRFMARELEEPEGVLAKLQQTSTVAEYRGRFEQVSNRAMILPPAFLVRCFISGLRDDIKQSVLVHQPTALEDAMRLAQLHENRINLEKGYFIKIIKQYISCKLKS